MRRAAFGARVTAPFASAWQVSIGAGSDRDTNRTGAHPDIVAQFCPVFWCSQGRWWCSFGIVAPECIAVACEFAEPVEEPSCATQATLVGPSVNWAIATNASRLARRRRTNTQIRCLSQDGPTVGDARIWCREMP